MSVCLKRFPLISFSRYSAPAVVARSLKTVASDSEPSEHAKVKKRRTKKVSEPKPPPPPNILEWNSIKEHLKELSDTNGKLVIADIERCRPRSHAAPGSNEYEKEYNDLLEKITKSFTGKQLRQFLELYELPLPSARGRKEPYATTIIEQQWNWPSLSAIREQQRETETDVEIFPLTPSQAFLMLGKDGADARTLSIKYRVRMAYLADPLSLRVEGMVGSLKKLAKHVADLKAAMVEEVFELPVDKPISRDLLHRISRLSGAFTENFGQRKVRVSFNKSSPRTAVVAKRLAARAACEGNDEKQTQLFFHLPPSIPSSSPVPASITFPHAYSLYPFLSPRSLSWTVSASGVFRLRRVEEWLGTRATEDLKKTGGLLMGRGRIVTLQQQEVDLRTLLLDAHPESPSSTSRVVTASIGHLLLTSAPSDQVSLTPPLQGDWKLPQILTWMEKRSEPTVFTPTLPTPLLDSQPNQHRMLHRLVYYSTNAGDDVDAAHKIIKVELILPRSMKELPESSNGGSELIEPRCWLGQKIDLDVMMPDRPADIRFSIFDSTVLPDHQWPLQLEEYMLNLQAFLSYQDRDASQPDAPLTVTHDGGTYVLHSSSTVRQNVEHLDTTDSASVQVITESALDLEGDQKSASCQVICDDVVSEAGWKSFMQHCDTMSTIPASTIKHTIKPTTPLV